MYTLRKLQVTHGSKEIDSVINEKITYKQFSGCLLLFVPDYLELHSDLVVKLFKDKQPVLVDAESFEVVTEDLFQTEDLETISHLLDFGEVQSVSYSSNVLTSPSGDNVLLTLNSQMLRTTKDDVGYYCFALPLKNDNYQQYRANFSLDKNHIILCDSTFGENNIEDIAGENQLVFANLPNSGFDISVLEHSPKNILLPASLGAKLFYLERNEI